MAAPGTLTGPTIPIAKVVRRSRALQCAATAPKGTGVVVEIGPARIEVGSGFNAELLRDVVPHYWGGSMIPSGVQILVALEPINMRLSFDRLAGIALE